MKTVLAALVAAFLCLACATGVEMTKDEAAACKAEGCSAWTIRELSMLARKFFNEGYQAGKKSL